VSYLALYVAVISAGAAVVGGAIPQILNLVRDRQVAVRAERQRLADQRRQACLDLLDAAGSLRTHVSNVMRYQGAEFGQRLEVIRDASAAVQKYADAVAIRAGDGLEDAAQNMAQAAGRLAEAVDAVADWQALQLRSEPGIQELRRTEAAFRQAVLADC
jgi:hypothetical protein